MRQYLPDWFLTGIASRAVLLVRAVNVKSQLSADKATASGGIYPIFEVQMPDSLCQMQMDWYQYQN